jgi:hypothetical protein
MTTTPLTIRIDAKLKAAAAKAAKGDARSLTSLIVKLLTEYLKDKRASEAAVRVNLAVCAGHLTGCQGVLTPLNENSHPLPSHSADR